MNKPLELSMGMSDDYLQAVSSLVLHCNHSFHRTYISRIANVDNIRNYIFTNLSRNLVVSMEHDSFICETQTFCEIRENNVS